MFSQSHSKAPLLLDRQLNQRDPVPSVPKGVSVSPNAKAQANKNDRVVGVVPNADPSRY